MDSQPTPSLYGRAGIHNVDWPRVEFIHVLRHVFFMTRLQMAIVALYDLGSEHPMGAEGLKSSLVTFLCSCHMINHILTWLSTKVHVLIVQGYGSILGLSSPSSYLVQELLLNFWPTRTSDASLRQSMQRIILSARPSDADRKFVMDICIDSDRWWENMGNGNPLPTFEELDQRFTAKTEQVCDPRVIQITSDKQP